MVTRGGATRVSWLLAVLLAIAATAGAAPPYDGSKPMQCAISTVMVCSDPSVCVRGTAATVDLPPVLTVDVGQKVISGAASGRTIKIASAEHEAGRLLLSGSEPGGSWNLAIVEDSGAMSSVVLVRNGGFLMFGTCSN